MQDHPKIDGTQSISSLICRLMIHSIEESILPRARGDFLSGDKYLDQTSGQLSTLQWPAARWPINFYLGQLTMECRVTERPKRF